MPSIECSRRWPDTRRVSVAPEWSCDGTTRRDGDTVVCTVTVALEHSGIRPHPVTRQHVYDAINRAVERIGDLMRRRAA